MPIPPKKATNLRRQSIYLLPNLLTLCALFSGFYAIVQGMNAQFSQAAIAIFAAMLLDGIDGRVARLTRTQSEFGREFDSLSDMVSFGVAPALVVYEWALHDFGKLGWMVAFIYCASAALRLARFNTNASTLNKDWFQGLPSPAAAALIASLIWNSNEVFLESAWASRFLSYTALGLTLAMGLSMVSSLPFWSFKAFHMRKTVPFVMLLTTALLLIIVAAKPPVISFFFFLAYAASGYVLWLWRYLRRHKK